jgi:hypothetical protein
VYADRRDAYRRVTQLIGERGTGIAEDLLLACQDESGIPSAIAAGQTLVLEAALTELQSITATSRRTVLNEWTAHADWFGRWVMEAKSEIVANDGDSLAGAAFEQETVEGGKRRSTLAKVA